MVYAQASPNRTLVAAIAQHIILKNNGTLAGAASLSSKKGMPMKQRDSP